MNDDMVGFIIGCVLMFWVTMFVWFNTPIAVYLKDGRVIAVESHNFRWHESPYAGGK